MQKRVWETIYKSIYISEWQVKRWSEWGFPVWVEGSEPEVSYSHLGVKRGVRAGYWFLLLHVLASSIWFYNMILKRNGLNGMEDKWVMTF